jgi:hypothetical protein
LYSKIETDTGWQRCQVNNLAQIQKRAQTDNERDTSSDAAKQKKCGNCKVAGHSTKAQCAKTEQERPKKKARKGFISNANLVNMLNLYYYIH